MGDNSTVPQDPIRIRIRIFCSSGPVLHPHLGERMAATRLFFPSSCTALNS
jgi:hypothetical protein